MTLADEIPVAVVVNGSTLAVMMCTPEDIEDFAVGFLRTEGITQDLPEVEVVHHATGIEARVWLPEDQAEAVAQRRRSAAGPVGCGLCGIDSLEQALRPLPQVTGTLALTEAEIAGATDALRGHQPLHDATRAVHAAGFLRPGAGIVMAREDVGRHNALDKLIGALARAGIDAATGAIVLTSRVSTEMVQKTVMAGAPVLIAVSAPTVQALDIARSAQLTVAALAKNGSYRVFTHPDRLKGARHVA